MSGVDIFLIVGFSILRLIYFIGQPKVGDANQRFDWLEKPALCIPKRSVFAI